MRIENSSENGLRGGGRAGDEPVLIITGQNCFTANGSAAAEAVEHHKAIGIIIIWIMMTGGGIPFRLLHSLLPHLPEKHSQALPDLSVFPLAV